MSDDLLIIIMVSMVTNILFLILAILGRTEASIRFKKALGLMSGRIVAKEIRKDGKIYTHTPKIVDKQIKIGKRTYGYNIKHTLVNSYNLREGFFSELTSSQINPMAVTIDGSPMSSTDLSNMLTMATSMALIPKQLLSTKQIPWIMLIIGIIVVVAILSGGVQP